jgi:hypothetical protein
MWVSILRRGGIVAVVTAVVGGGVAIAAGIPLPETGKAYQTGPTHNGLTLSLVVSATNAKRLIAGPAQPPLGSQYTLPVGSLTCTKAPRNPSLPKSDHPFLLFSFPGAKLTLGQGGYSFFVTKTVKSATVTGSSAKPFKYKLQITGFVSSAQKIIGSVDAIGGPCATKDALSYTAKLAPKASVAPGA